MLQQRMLPASLCEPRLWQGRAKKCLSMVFTIKRQLGDIKELWIFPGAIFDRDEGPNSDKNMNTYEWNGENLSMTTHEHIWTQNYPVIYLCKWIHSWYEYLISNTEISSISEHSHQPRVWSVQPGVKIQPLSPVHGSSIRPFTEWNSH